MTSKQTNWLLGCGIGCAAMTLIVVGLGFVGARFVRQTQQGFDSAIESRGTLEQRFGTAQSFIPQPDGGVAAERMEAFLAVREATMEARERLAEAWAGIPLTPEAVRELEAQDFGDKMRSAFEITRTGVGLGTWMGRLYGARNQAMLDAGIGFGEYTYIYSLAYYSWLGHSPEEGPETAGRDAGESTIGPSMGEILDDRVHKDLRRILRNQLDSLPAESEWRPALAEELAALESRSGRVPWQDGLPAAVVASFEPYRERLESSYSSATNPFELGRNRRRGRYSVGLE